ncbi:DUF4097 domain-containing protein [Ornithinimicrobium sp. F0845]|uniref:DUF4097 family beta strand repeat-containing protein n=1 Tax=Ornithinimicrobium sp. F0845 TaxID=2926412 RepID=UPI001FF5D266|nr:DUF4097 family beta strand repeat-containing protein [Ornithinimicrobium sp. F0845]MCK0110830.1 DUF4097 domain-containing protein [Ornithinimicrobium sp. F0845]
MDRTFETPTPPDLSVEIGSGSVEVLAGETNGRTLVTVTGKGSDETTIEQRGNTIAVIGPRSRHGFSFAFGSNQLTVRISTPRGSALSTKLGSADLVASGTLGACSLRSGSGDNQLEDIGDLELTSGSGDLQVGAVTGNASTRNGSGDVRIGAVSGDVEAITGSGDIVVGRLGGRANAKSGSGNVRLEQCDHGARVTTASGDISVDRLSGGSLEARTASGDLAVGVSAGLPAWTDIHTLSGDVTSTLMSLGQPAEGAPFVELRLRSVSGDITVGHLPAESNSPTDQSHATTHTHQAP